MGKKRAEIMRVRPFILNSSRDGKLQLPILGFGELVLRRHSAKVPCTLYVFDAI